MNSGLVNKHIRAVVWPRLREAGFETFTARSAWRHSHDRIDVLNFQSFNSYLAESLGVTTFSFALNLGTSLRYVPDGRVLKVKDARPIPAEYECQFRGRLRPTTPKLPRHRDLWVVAADGANAGDCVADVEAQLPGALSWFDRLREPSEVMKLLVTVGHDDEWWGFGANPSPVRSLIVGYVALRLGDVPSARESLANAVASNCFSSLFRTVDEAIARATG